MCALRPGVPKLSENIRVRSIIGRFLEHTRVFHFRGGGESKVYLSSADWMDRNFFRRIEVMFPLEDDRLKQRVTEEILPALLADNVKARLLTPDGAYGRARAVDAADRTGNIERGGAVGGRIGAGPEVSVEQIRKLKRIAADRGYRLVPGHDPVVWPALTRELASRETGQRYASLSVLEGTSYLRIAVIGAPDILGAEKTLAADALPRM